MNYAALSDKEEEIGKAIVDYPVRDRYPYLLSTIE